MADKIVIPQCIAVINDAQCEKLGEFIPELKFLNKVLGHMPKPEELAKFVLCGEHMSCVTAAAKAKGELVKFHSYVSQYDQAVKLESERITREAEAQRITEEKKRKEAEEAERAEQARRKFRQEMETYLDLLKPGARRDHRGENLLEIFRCNFGDCGNESKGNSTFVPNLFVMNKSLGRDTELEDLNDYTICGQHVCAIVKSGVQTRFYKVGEAISLINERKSRAERTLANVQAAAGYLANVLGNKTEGQKKDEDNKPVTWDNVITLDTGAIACIGKGCTNSIPADKHTHVCDECRHECEGGCGKRIPKWYDKCRGCAPSAGTATSPLGNKTSPNGRELAAARKNAKRKRDSAIRDRMKNGGNKKQQQQQ